jgi:hypothetical protein
MLMSSGLKGSGGAAISCRLSRGAVTLQLSRDTIPKGTTSLDRASTQKPAAHCCGRVSGATFHFGENTMVQWTSQAEFAFLFHRSTNRAFLI